MKIIALGDIHGRTTWKNIISKEIFDRVVFIGDYFDTHEDISANLQKENFRNIIAYKKANPEKTVLLLGNHDYHYLNVGKVYSGYQEAHSADISELLKSALKEDLMQMCFIAGKYIFTHAGITKTWLQSTGYEEKGPLDVFINDLFKYKPLRFGFTPGIHCSPTGDDITQTPIWVRPGSLAKNAINGYIQVVGHTTQPHIRIREGKIAFIDTLGESGQYLVIEDGKISIERL